MSRQRNYTTDRAEIWRSGGRTYIRLRAQGDAFQYRIDDLKYTFPRRCRYIGDQRAWAIDASLNDVITWARRHFDDREIEIEYVSDYDYQQEQQASKPPSKLEQAYRTLCLAPEAPDELIAAAHRILARIHHPDCGGSHERMVSINNAHDVITGARR